MKSSLGKKEFYTSFEGSNNNEYGKVRKETTNDTKKKEEKHFKQLSDFSLWLQKIKNTFVFFFFKYFYAISTFSVKHQNVFLLGEVQSRAGKKNDISGKSNDERERERERKKRMSRDDDSAGFSCKLGRISQRLSLCTTTENKTKN